MSFPLSQVKWNLKTQDDAQGLLCISPALTVPGQSPSLPPFSEKGAANLPGPRDMTVSCWPVCCHQGGAG